MPRKESSLWRIPLKADWPRLTEGRQSVPVIEDRSERLIALLVFDPAVRNDYVHALQRARSLVSYHNAPIKEKFKRLVAIRQETSRQLPTKATHEKATIAIEQRPVTVNPATFSY